MRRPAECTAPDDRLGRQLDAARKQEQHGEAAAEVVVAQQPAGPATGNVQDPVSHSSQELAVIVVNHGRYAVTGMQAQLSHNGTSLVGPESTQRYVGFKALPEEFKGYFALRGHGVTHGDVLGSDGTDLGMRFDIVRAENPVRGSAGRVAQLAGWPSRSPVMCLRFAFLVIMRVTAWLRLSGREEAWRTAEILILRRRLSVLHRRQPHRPHLTWAARALLAALLSVMPQARCQGAAAAGHPGHDPALAPRRRPAPLGGLRVQELPPGRAVPTRHGIDTRRAQGLIDGRGRERDAQLGRLAVNTPATPERVFSCQADGEPGDVPDRRRPAGSASFAGVVFPGGESAVPGQQRRGRDREDRRPAPARDEPGELAWHTFCCNFG